MWWLLSLALLMLVEALGSDDFRTRERAPSILRHMDLIALPAIREAVRHEDPEIRHRARFLLDEVFSVKSTAGTVPWIDMLPSETPDRQKIIADYLKIARGSDSPSYAWELDWVDYRIATCLYVRQLREKGWSKGKIREVLDKMEKREETYKKDHNVNPLP